MRSNPCARRVMLTLIVAVLLVSPDGFLRAAPGADQPTTAPTTAPSTAPADEGPATPSKNRAWVSGTILGTDGKPAVGVLIRVEKQEPMGMGGGPGGKDTGPKEYRATTDDNGNFLIKEMFINPYIIIAGNNDVGWIYQELPVNAGQETKLGAVKLTKIN
jgi:hypothetical protein